MIWDYVKSYFSIIWSIFQNIEIPIINLRFSDFIMGMFVLSLLYYLLHVLIGDADK